MLPSFELLDALCQEKPAETGMCQGPAESQNGYILRFKCEHIGPIVLNPLSLSSRSIHVKKEGSRGVWTSGGFGTPVGATLLFEIRHMIVMLMAWALNHVVESMMSVLLPFMPRAWEPGSSFSTENVACIPRHP